MDKKELRTAADNVAENNEELENKVPSEFDEIEEVPDDVEALSAEPPVLDLDFSEPSLDELAMEELEAENLDDDIDLFKAEFIDDEM